MLALHPLWSHVNCVQLRLFSLVFCDFDVRFCLFLPRGVGCIFFEMATGRPMFPGGTVDEQLHLIFKVSVFLPVVFRRRRTFFSFIMNAFSF
jgi:hypothetical protein